MRLALTPRTTLSAADFLRTAIAGLVPTNDAAAELVEALCDVCERDADVHADASVAAVYRDCNGNVSETARVLGIARSTVRAHLARVTATAVPMRRAANDTE